MKEKINIEAEKNELILRNETGDYVIIPKGDRAKVQAMLDNDEHDKIDELVSTLPTTKDYAEDGTVVPNPEFEAMSLVTLNRNKNLNFIQRALEPSEDKKIQTNTIKGRENEDPRQTSTHLMSAETDEEGNWIVFPTVVERDGEMISMVSNEENGFPKEAWDYAHETGEFVKFSPQQKELALYFASEGYKRNMR